MLLLFFISQKLISEFEIQPGFLPTCTNGNVVVCNGASNDFI